MSATLVAGREVVDWSVMARLAGIELGGTKCIAVLGDGLAIRERRTFPTTTPDETLGLALAALDEWNAAAPLEAIGFASFGPVRIDPLAPDFGRILDTPKPHWRDADLLAPLRGFRCPLRLDTDVNGAALAELELGAGRGCTSLAYITIGTGVGGGFVVAGTPIHGRMHPEIGHIRLRRMAGDAFAGACAVHGDCIEGLIAGPALAARFGRPPTEIAPDDLCWDAVAHDLGELLATLILALSPQRITVGGGVMMRQPHLLVRAIPQTARSLAGYLAELDPAALAETIVLPQLGDDAGPVGALVLARDALAASGPAPELRPIVS